VGMGSVWVESVVEVEVEVEVVVVVDGGYVT
jgi:hypothetical protein